MLGPALVISGSRWSWLDKCKLHLYSTKGFFPYDSQSIDRFLEISHMVLMYFHVSLVLRTLQNVCTGVQQQSCHFSDGANTLVRKEAGCRVLGPYRRPSSRQAPSTRDGTHDLAGLELTCCASVVIRASSHSRFGRARGFARYSDTYPARAEGRVSRLTMCTS